MTHLPPSVFIGPLRLASGGEPGGSTMTIAAYLSAGAIGLWFGGAAISTAMLWRATRAPLPVRLKEAASDHD